MPEESSVRESPAIFQAMSFHPSEKRRKSISHKSAFEASSSLCLKQMPEGIFHSGLFPAFRSGSGEGFPVYQMIFPERRKRIGPLSSGRETASISGGSTGEDIDSSQESEADLEQNSLLFQRYILHLLHG